MLNSNGRIENVDGSNQENLNFAAEGEEYIYDEMKKKTWDQTKKHMQINQKLFLAYSRILEKENILTWECLLFFLSNWQKKTHTKTTSSGQSASSISKQDDITVSHIKSLKT